LVRVSLGQILYFQACLRSHLLGPLPNHLVQRFRSGFQDARDDHGDDQIPLAAGGASEDRFQAEATQGAQGGGDVAMGSGALNLESVGRGDQGFSFEKTAEGLDLSGRPGREVGEGALDDFAADAGGLAEEDGWGRAAVGDGLNLHGTCGGGIWWNKDRRYKNAIANELFLSIAVRLAAVERDPARRPAYLEWVKREWHWFAASGMINARDLINDGLTASCRNNGRNPWTYNQGVILGGLSGLAAQSGEKLLLERAQSIALAAIAELTDEDGILHDTCEPNCGADGVQFKGIFARNLGVLNSAAPSPRFRTFLQANAQRICQIQTPDHQSGVLWSRPSHAVNAATQVSALDVILAAATAAGGAEKR